MKNMTAHMNGSDISSLCFSYDNLTLASRGGSKHSASLHCSIFLCISDW